MDDLFEGCLSGCAQLIGQFVIVYGILFAVLYLILDGNVVLSIIGAGVVVAGYVVFSLWAMNTTADNKPPKSMSEAIREAREKRRKRRKRR